MLSPVSGSDVLSPVMLCLLSGLVRLMALSSGCLRPPASDQSDRGSGLSSDLYSSDEIEGWLLAAMLAITSNKIATARWRPILAKRRSMTPTHIIWPLVKAGSQDTFFNLYSLGARSQISIINSLFLQGWFSNFTYLKHIESFMVQDKKFRINISFFRLVSVVSGAWYRFPSASGINPWDLSEILCLNYHNILSILSKVTSVYIFTLSSVLTLLSILTGQYCQTHCHITIH